MAEPAANGCRLPHGSRYAGRCITQNVNVRSHLRSVCRDNGRIGRSRTGVSVLPTAGRFFACLAMVGAGAVAGTLSGGHTNAARSPDDVPAAVASDNSPSITPAAAIRPAAAAPVADHPTPVPDNTVVRQTARAAPPPAPAAVIAARFPAGWQTAIDPAAMCAAGPGLCGRAAARRAPGAGRGVRLPARQRRSGAGRDAQARRAAQAVEARGPVQRRAARQHQDAAQAHARPGAVLAAGRAGAARDLMADRHPAGRQAAGARAAGRR